jgi:hypothetical protein
LTKRVSDTEDELRVVTNEKNNLKLLLDGTSMQIVAQNATADTLNIVEAIADLHEFLGEQDKIETGNNIVRNNSQTLRQAEQAQENSH